MVTVPTRGTKKKGLRATRQRVHASALPARLRRVRGWHLYKSAARPCELVAQHVREAGPSGQIVLRVPGTALVGGEMTPVGHLLDEETASRLAVALTTAVEERMAHSESHVVVLPDSEGVLCQRCGFTWRNDAALPIRVYERGIDEFASRHAWCPRKVLP